MTQPPTSKDALEVFVLALQELILEHLPDSDYANSLTTPSMGEK